MEAKLVFPPGTAKTLTTSDLFVEGVDVYELRGELRGTATAFRTDGYWGAERSELSLTSDLKKRGVTSKERTPREGFLVDDGAWLAGGPSCLYRSTDKGKSWKREAVPCEDEQIVSIARHDGKLWVAGMDGYLAVQEGKSWKSIERPKATEVSFSEFGHSLPYPTVTLTKLVIAGDELFALGHGVWQLHAKKAVLVAPSKNLIVDLAKSAKGTLIAVGLKGTVLRREGKSWKAGTSGKNPLIGVVPMGDLLLLVSTSALSISSDDGKSFKAIKGQPTLNAREARYTVAAPDGRGGALVAGWRGLMVRVSDGDSWVSASAGTKKIEKEKKAPAAVHAKPKAKSAKDESSFVADILATPHDDGPRLVYADWLTEHGDPRGELIQLQCLLKREVVGTTMFRPLDIDDPHPDHLALGKRESELLKKHAKEWLASIRKYMYQWSWQRGFLKRVTGNASFFPGAKAILSTQPVTRLELTGLKKGDFANIAKLELGPVRSLVLTQNRFGPKDVPLFLGKNMANVEELILAGNPIGDEGLIAIASSKALPNLQVLGLVKTDVTEIGLQALADSKTLPKLAWVTHDLEGKRYAKVLAALNKKLVRVDARTRAAWGDHYGSE